MLKNKINNAYEYKQEKSRKKLFIEIMKVKKK